MFTAEDEITVVTAKGYVNVSSTEIAYLFL